MMNWWLYILNIKREVTDFEKKGIMKKEDIKNAADAKLFLRGVGYDFFVTF